MNTYKTADLSGAEWISTGGACCTPMIRKTLSFSESDLCEDHGSGSWHF